MSRAEQTGQSAADNAPQVTDKIRAIRIVCQFFIFFLYFGRNSHFVEFHPPDSKKNAKMTIDKRGLLKEKKMKAVVEMVAGLYSVSLCAFLVFIRKGFLQMSGESSLPSIDLNCPDDFTED